jgi:hypothetical protein
MATLKNDAQGGVRTFIEEQKSVPDKKTSVLLAEFDTEYDIVYDGSLSGAPEDYALIPRGATALLDAIGRTIEAVRAKARKRDKVIFNIITDGQENSSKEWTKLKVKTLMDECRKDGWKFMFMAADENAIADAQSWGYTKMETQIYANTSLGTRQAHSHMSDTTILYRK